MKRAIFLSIFGELSDPRLLADLAVEAEDAGWDGVFLWDHMAYREPIVDVADPWVALGAMAHATDRIRLGPMVTPLPRRRPHKVARESVSVDVLSRGRLVMGIGLGGDPGRELSGLGEQTDAVARGRMLDESIDVLLQLWSGEVVDHRGEHYTVDGMRFGPMPVQRPRPPIWVAGRYPNQRPLRRAARFEGLFPVQVTEPEQLAEMVVQVAQHRADAGLTGPYDVAIDTPADDDPARWAEAGATWWLCGFSPFTVTAAEVRAAIATHPNVG